MWRKAVRDGRDAGMSLVEVLVAISLAAIVGTITTEAIISTMKGVQNTQARTQMIQQAQLAIQQIQKQVRSGNVIYPESQDGNYMKVYTMANGKQRCVEWLFTPNTNALMSRSWAPPAAGGTSDDVTAWKQVADGIVNVPKPIDAADKAEWVFVKNGTQPSMLQVHLWVQFGGTAAGREEVKTVITGRNTVFGYDDSVCQTPPA